MADDIVKLEELFRSGFILEEEYNTRKEKIESAPPAPKRSQSGLDMQTTLSTDLSELPAIIATIKAKKDASSVTDAVTKLRKMLAADKNPPIQEVIQTNVLPTLAEFLASNESPAILLFEATWAITNIASGSTENTRCVVENGFVPLLIRLLSHPTSDVVEQAIWALGNIAGDCTKHRDVVLQEGVVPKILEMNAHTVTSVSLMRNIMWTCSNLCRGKPAPDFRQVGRLLEMFAKAAYSQDASVVTDSLWGISYISDGPNDHIQKVLESGISRRIVELLLHESIAIVVPALRTVGNIVTGSDVQTQVLLNQGVLTCLKKLLSHTKITVRRETCWTISNITAGNEDQIQAVIDARIIEDIVKLIKEDQFVIKKEAAWALSNASSGANDNQMKIFVEQYSFIECFCELLTVPSDPKILLVALAGLDNILSKWRSIPAVISIFKRANGKEYVEPLLIHQSREVRDAANKLLVDKLSST